ncbi:MAG: ERCC4 domain-containing protein [Candidatus Hodarchaeales archaeon]|jgi:Fanconi anemia group M protein
MSRIKGIESRLYQEMLYMEAKDQNTLIVLPTGLGKTIIILYMVGYFIDKFPEKKILIATPTRPLVYQIGETLRRYLEIDPDIILEVAGSITPQKRALLYQKAQILIGTPQTFSNDFDTDRIIPSNFSLLCFDEAHRATGNYAYVKIVQNFEDEGFQPRIIGFTATPGNKPEKVEDVIKNLHIQAIRSRFEDDPDVKPYVSTHKPKVVWVNLPDEYKQVIKLLDKYQSEIVKEIKERGLEPPGRYINKNTALEMQQQVTILMQDDPNIGELLYFIPNLIRILHLKEIIETQGFPQGNITLAKWYTNPTQKTLKMFLDHPLIQNSYQIMTNNPVPHPKLVKLLEILQKRTKKLNSKIIVFSNYRDSIDYLLEALQKQNVTARKFVGQASQKKGSSGMSQKEQLTVLDEFKNGTLNILLSTSVGEEGLDVGQCDLVIFYDSVPSVVRSIQRTGRGRKKQSEVIRLVARGTKDTALYYATLKQQKKLQKFIRHELPAKMNIDIATVVSKSPEKVKSDEILIENRTNNKSSPNLIQYLTKEVEKKVKPQVNEKEIIDQTSQRNLTKGTHTSTPDFSHSEDKITILIDNREARSQVPRLLKKDKSTKIQLVNLAEGDYRVSEECVIERKTMHDLAESIVDGRLFEQISKKLSTYRKPIILIEGADHEVKMNIKPNAIRGAIASIVLSYRIPILRTFSEEETAEMIRAIAKREQKDKKFKSKIQTISKQYPIKEIQRFILSAIPGVNRSKADQILEEFKTIKDLANSDFENLINLPGIGKILTERILRILQEPASEKEHLE